MILAFNFVIKEVMTLLIYLTLNRFVCMLYMVSQYNANLVLDNSRYHAKTEFNNCFTMYSKPKTKNNTNGTHENFMPY